MPGMLSLVYMSEKHILIVEDEADIREALTESVIDAGFKVSTAENGALGLEKALNEKPDLILLDLKMPVMDGHTALKKLRQDPWGKDAKVIVLTSMDDVRNIAESHEGHITDYIIKGHTSLDEVLNKIRLVAFV